LEVAIMSDDRDKGSGPGRLELTFDRAVFPDQGRSYTVTLCDHVLFEADSLEKIAGVHKLEEAVVVGAGAHKLTVTGSSASTKEPFVETYPIEIPARQPAYAIRSVECRLEGETRGDSGRQPAPGFHVTGDAATRGQPEATIAFATEFASCCSSKA